MQYGYEGHMLGGVVELFSLLRSVLLSGMVKFLSYRNFMFKLNGIKVHYSREV